MKARTQFTWNLTQDVRSVNQKHSISNGEWIEHFFFVEAVARERERENCVRVSNNNRQLSWCETSTKKLMVFRRKDDTFFDFSLMGDISMLFSCTCHKARKPICQSRNYTLNSKDAISGSTHKWKCMLMCVLVLEIHFQKFQNTKELPIFAFSSVDPKSQDGEKIEIDVTYMIDLKNVLFYTVFWCT